MKTHVKSICRTLLMAATVSLLGFSAGDMRATPGTKAGGGENELLSERLASEFPSLKRSLAAREGASYEKTQRTLAGGEVSGLLAHGSLTSAPAGKADAEVVRPALKPEEEAALRSLAERESKGAAFKAFFPSRYSEPFAVEGGGMSAVLHPLGARSAAAQREKGQIVYHDAYPETDSLHVVGAGRSEEFLYLRNERAPRRFDYELSEVKGAREVTLEGGAVKFAGEKGVGGLQIEAPWVVDARGKRLAGAVKWELGEARTDGSRRLSLVVLEGAALAYPAAIDPSWSTTGSLAAGRAYYTATLLPSGKVLVAGGFYLNGYLNSAELYDPAAGTWSGTGALATARGYHTATLLPNGKVLVAGGVNSISGSLTSAELYDPAAGAWNATGALATARGVHTATLLANGKVLVAGGSGNLGSYLSSAELYDPAAGTWSGTGALAMARYFHTATLLANGKVLVAGGYDSTNNSLSSAELYDPWAGTWSGTGALAAARAQHTATVLANGEVLVAAGYDSNTFVGSSYLSSAELYEPAAGTWSGTGALATARYQHTATLLANGKVLVRGGYEDNNFNYLRSAELYDPAGGTWTGTVATARVSHTATLLGNGKVLVAGGYEDFNSNYIRSAELYNPAAIASDNASNSPYQPGNMWPDASNGGTGFGPWSFAVTGGAGRYIGATGVNQNSSFGIYAGDSTNSSVANRPFTGALLTGQTFSVQMGATNVDVGGEVGMNLLDGTNAVFTFKYNGGPVWQLNDGGSDFGTNIPFLPNTPINFSFRYNGGAGYDVVITQGATSYSGLGYTANSVISNITGVRFFSNLQGGGESLGFDNLAIDALSLVSAVSRLTHGAAGDFDVPLALSGPVRVECRSASTYNIVLTFDNGPITSGTAKATAGTGTAGAPTFSGSTMTVPLTGVANAQTLTLTVNAANVNGLLPSASVSIGFLIGDTGGDRSVNSADVGQTKAQSGIAVTASNFREDVNHDGNINASDVGMVKSKSGTALP